MLAFVTKVARRRKITLRNALHCLWMVHIKVDTHVDKTRKRSFPSRIFASFKAVTALFWPYFHGKTKLDVTSYCSKIFQRNLVHRIAYLPDYFGHISVGSFQQAKFSKKSRSPWQILLLIWRCVRDYSVCSEGMHASTPKFALRCCSLMCLDTVCKVSSASLSIVHTCAPKTLDRAHFVGEMSTVQSFRSASVHY